MQVTKEEREKNDGKDNGGCLLYKDRWIDCKRKGEGGELERRIALHHREMNDESLSPGYDVLWIE